MKSWVRNSRLMVVVMLVWLAGCSAINTPASAPIETAHPAARIPELPTQTPGAPAATNLPTTKVRSRDGMVMVYVPAGTFEMGTTDAQMDEAIQACRENGEICEREHYKDEQPAHTVSLDAYWIDQTEVNNLQFADFLNYQGNQTEEGIQWWEPGEGHRGIVYGLIEQAEGVYRPIQGYEMYPVIEVSWYGARAYCTWASAHLPQEAQWEYAARGPEGRVYPWGDTLDSSKVNYAGTGFNEGQTPWMPAGSFPGGASWCGALDMAGNVWEWVADWWAEGYYQWSPAENPPGPASGTVRIGRGGSWYDPPWQVRSAFRKGLSPSSSRVHWVGFRCAMPAGGPTL